MSIFVLSLTVFSCDQAALTTPLSACLSVCLLAGWLSVCLSVTPFSGVIPNGRSDVHAKGQGHRSKVRVTEVITQLSRFRTVTPI